MMKQCEHCGVSKDPQDFHLWQETRNKDGSRTMKYWCNDRCFLDYAVALAKKRGITGEKSDLEVYDDKENEQKG